jgi:hypothetical protein
MAAKKTPRTSILALVPLAALCPSLARALDFSASFVGPTGGDYQYSSAANWNIGLVPINISPANFFVTIPAGKRADFAIAKPAGGWSQVTDFTLGNSAGSESSFYVLPGSAFQVIGKADIYGMIDVNNASFKAVGPDAALRGSRASVYAKAGAFVQIGDADPDTPGFAYSSVGFKSPGVNYVLFQADGSGSQLKLGAISEINARYDDGSGAGTAHNIIASNKGLVDLSGVTKITGPVRDEDRFHLVASGGGTINLANLQSISGGGQQFITAVDPGTVVSLPKLQLAERTYFQAQNGGRIDAPTLTQYSSVGFKSPGVNYVLFQADGSGSQLKLGAISEINARYDDGSGAGTAHNIIASNKGLVDLSGVTKITGPVRDEDRFHLVASGGGTINLASLKAIDSTGTIHLTATDSARISMPSIRVMGTGGTSVNLSGNSQIRAGRLSLVAGTTITLDSSAAYVGGIQAPWQNAPASSIGLKGGTASLQATGSIDLGKAISLSATKGDSVSIGGDFHYLHTDETKNQLGSAAVKFTGAGLQQYEVGGIDVDVVTALLGNDNFGVGRMTVGQVGQPTIVELRDDVNNGNRGGVTPVETMYIFGANGRQAAPGGSNPPSLELLGGSYLVMNGVKTYVRESAGWVKLHDRLPAGQRQVAYGGGFLVRSLSDVPGAWDVDAGGAWSQKASWYLSCPNAPGAWAIFGGGITAPQQVAVDVPVTVGLLAFDNPNAYTINGPQPITLQNVAGSASIRVDDFNGYANHVIAANLRLQSDVDLSNRTAGSLKLTGSIDNSSGNRLTKTGPGLVTIAGPQSHAPGAALIAQDGTLRLDTDAGSVSSRTASLEAAGGKILLNTSQHVASLYAFDGTIELAAGHNKVIVADDVSAGVAGKVDLMDNALIVRSTASERDSMLQRVASQARTSYAASKHWQGPGLSSSTAAAFPKSLTGLAVLLNDDGKGHTLRSQIFGEPATLNDILAIYTWNGDVNLDGKIDAADYFLVDSGFITQQAGYRNGDLNYDGQVDAGDYFLIDSAFLGQTATSIPLTSPVPEPGTLGLLAVVAGGLAVDRRRSRRG